MRLIARYNFWANCVCVWLAHSLLQGQFRCSVVRQVLSKSMACRLSPRALQCGLILCFICQILAATHGVQEEETCVQGFTPAKRTLQATQRIAPRTVMSSSEQVWQRRPCEVSIPALHAFTASPAPAEKHNVNSSASVNQPSWRVALQAV